MKAVHLRTEHLENPLGLQTVRPVFSWHTDGGLQSAYEIIVRNGKTAVWKSGKVTTGRMLARCGYDAAPREHLTWRIRLWDENDHPECFTGSSYHEARANERGRRANDTLS